MWCSLVLIAIFSIIVGNNGIIEAFRPIRALFSHRSFVSRLKYDTMAMHIESDSNEQSIVPSHTDTSDSPPPIKRGRGRKKQPLENGGSSTASNEEIQASLKKRSTKSIDKATAPKRERKSKVVPDKKTNSSNLSEFDLKIIEKLFEKSDSTYFPPVQPVPHEFEIVGWEESNRPSVRMSLDKPSVFPVLPDKPYAPQPMLWPTVDPNLPDVFQPPLYEGNGTDFSLQWSRFRHQIKCALVNNVRRMVTEGTLNGKSIIDLIGDEIAYAEKAKRRFGINDIDDGYNLTVTIDDMEVELTPMPLMAHEDLEEVLLDVWNSTEYFTKRNITVDELNSYRNLNVDLIPRPVEDVRLLGDLLPYAVYDESGMLVGYFLDWELDEMYGVGNLEGHSIFYLEHLRQEKERLQQIITEEKDRIKSEGMTALDLREEERAAFATPEELKYRLFRG